MTQAQPQSEWYFWNIVPCNTIWTIAQLLQASRLSKVPKDLLDQLWRNWHNWAMKRKNRDQSGLVPIASDLILAHISIFHVLQVTHFICVIIATCWVRIEDLAQMFPQSYYRFVPLLESETKIHPRTPHELSIVAVCFRQTSSQTSN